MDEQRKEKLKEAFLFLSLGLVAVIVAVILITLISNLGSDSDKLERIEKDVEEVKKTLSPYEDKNKLLRTQIVYNFTNSAKGGEQTGSFQKKIIVSSNIGKGYLYVKASADGKALKAGEDDVYVKIYGVLVGQYQEFGGHLIESKSLSTPKSENATELLYNLSDIKYKESYKQSDVEIISGDWLKMFNTGNTQFIVGFSSTEKIGVIEDLSIYYECGSEKQCSITVQ